MSTANRRVPIEGHWEKNKAEETAAQVCWTALILGVVVTAFAVFDGVVWAAVIGPTLLGVGIQVWVFLTLWRAWRHESRHQTAELLKALSER